MSDATTVPLADTADMIGVHQVFRDAFGAAAPLVGSVAPGDTARAEVVGTFYDNVLHFLKVHHEGEDDLLWDKLVERAPDEAETIRRIAGQHDDVSAGLAAAQERLAEWRADPQIDSGARLAGALASLGADLTRHLDEEERVILPIAARTITAPEWGELPAHGMQHFGGDKLWLVLGLIQEQMNADQIAQMESHMPPPAREFWVSTGRPTFDAFVADLRG